MPLFLISIADFDVDPSSTGNMDSRVRGNDGTVIFTMFQFPPAWNLRRDLVTDPGQPRQCARELVAMELAVFGQPEWQVAV